MTASQPAPAYSQPDVTRLLVRHLAAAGRGAAVDRAELRALLPDGPPVLHPTRRRASGRQASRGNAYTVMVGRALQSLARAGWIDRPAGAGQVTVTDPAAMHRWLAATRRRYLPPRPAPAPDRVKEDPC